MCLDRSLYVACTRRTLRRCHLKLGLNFGCATCSTHESYCRSRLHLALCGGMSGLGIGRRCGRWTGLGVYLLLPAPGNIFDSKVPYGFRPLLCRPAPYCPVGFATPVVHWSLSALPGIPCSWSPRLREGASEKSQPRAASFITVFRQWRNTVFRDGSNPCKSIAVINPA